MSTFRTRLAPSPTGHLHEGHFLHVREVQRYAAAYNAKILVRMEDHDRSRCRPEYESSIIRDLQSLGVQIPKNMWRQSERQQTYQMKLENLMSRSLVYACRCSRKDIQSATGQSSGELHYPGTCRDQDIPLDTPETSLRLKLPDAEYSFRDLFEGTVTENPFKTWGDVMIRDRLGQWTYMFAVVIDDLDQSINLIVRGKDLLQSTCRQLAMRDLIAPGSPVPLFAHHPLVLDTNGQKLSKSNQDTRPSQIQIETPLISWIQDKLPRSKAALISNGDDAALLRSSSRGTLVSTDMLLDGTHFRSLDTQPELIGRKAVAVNLSDIAAMGGKPESLFISLAIPKGMPLDWIKRVMSGAASMASEYQCTIDGGDTNTWNGPFAINVTILGRPHWRGPITRSGAQVGDVVMVSGSGLGDTLNTNHHLTFTPRVRESEWLMDHFEIHSMMDLSDGLAADVPKLAAACRKKIVIHAHTVKSRKSGDDALHSALCDGEDFELLFTCSKQTAIEIEQNNRWPCGFYRIGVVKVGQGVRIKYHELDNEHEVAFRGYEH